MASASGEVARLLAELADAESERDAYMREVAHLRSQLHHPPTPGGVSGQSSEAPPLSPSSSFVLDGTSSDAVPVSASGKAVGMHLRHAEELAMLEKFSLFSNPEGTISTTDLAKLHVKLGDPLNDGEAEVAMSHIGQNGRITFHDFVAYWFGTHGALQKGYGEAGVSAVDLALEREKKRARYFKRFQLKKRSTAARLDRVTTEATGDVNTLEYRLRFFYTEGGEKVEISPWHDVPLMNEDGTLNMIVEIPRWTRRKLEIATGEAYNPIRLDSKNGLPRILNYGDQLFNYGAFPQTWESPSLWTADNDGSGAEYHGDNDPIDVVEIGGRQQKCGSIIRVKVLGVLGLIDAGETDWKVFAIAVDDPMASKINTLAEMQEFMPGALEAERDYLRFYKHTPNSFLFGGEPRDEQFAKKMIAETHEAWKELVTGRVSGVVEGGGGGGGGGEGGGEGGHSGNPSNAEGSSSAITPSIVSAGLTRSAGSAVALSALVGAPENVTHSLLGGGGEVEGGEFF